MKRGGSPLGHGANECCTDQRNLRSAGSDFRPGCGVGMQTGEGAQGLHRRDALTGR